MNLKQALQELLRLLSSYDPNTFDVHPSFTLELIALIKGSGIEAKCFRLLITRLNLLMDAPDQAHLRSKELENLGNGIYSMHIDTGQHNTRILYGLLSDKKVILLHAFDEKQGKSATAYEGHIPIAKQRLEEVLSHE